MTHRNRKLRGKAAKKESASSSPPREHPIATQVAVLALIVFILGGAYQALTRIAERHAPTLQSLPVARQVIGSYEFSGGGARGSPKSSIGGHGLNCLVGYFYHASACRLEEQYRGQTIVALVLDLPVSGGTLPLAKEIRLNNTDLHLRTSEQVIEDWQRATASSIRLALIFLAVVLSALFPIVRTVQKTRAK